MISKHLLPSSIKHVFRGLGVSFSKNKVFLVRSISDSDTWALEGYLNTLALGGHTGAIGHLNHLNN